MNPAKIWILVFIAFALLTIPCMAQAQQQEWYFANENCFPLDHIGKDWQILESGGGPWRTPEAMESDYRHKGFKTTLMPIKPEDVGHLYGFSTNGGPGHIAGDRPGYWLFTDSKHSCETIVAKQKSIDAAAAEKEAAAREQAKEAAEAAAGYKRVTIADLMLDIDQYAQDGTKFSVEGFYYLQGNVAVLTDNQQSIVYAVHGNFSPVMAHAVYLLTKDATRDARKAFMECDNSMPIKLGIGGCGVTIRGHAVPCTLMNGMGAETAKTCVDVDDKD